MREEKKIYGDSWRQRGEGMEVKTGYGVKR